jgi:hypothetical protein
MWLITPIGFYSIVCKPDDADAETLTIRARVKSDLEALRQEYLPSLETISEDVGTDYRFRAKANRDAVGKALAQMTQQLDYGTSRMKLRTSREDAERRFTTRCGMFFLGSNAI